MVGRNPGCLALLCMFDFFCGCEVLMCLEELYFCLDTCSPSVLEFSPPTLSCIGRKCTNLNGGCTPSGVGLFGLRFAGVSMMRELVGDSFASPSLASPWF